MRSPLLRSALAMALLCLGALASQAQPHLPVGASRAAGITHEGAPASARVLAAPQSVPLRGGFYEGFDDIETLPENGWEMKNMSTPIGSNSWFQGNPDVFPAYDGDENAYIAANFNNAGVGAEGTISNWLILPEMTLENGTELRFWARANDEGWADRLQVRLSTAGASTDVGSTATSVGDFTYLLLDINPDYEGGVFVNEWTEYVATVFGLSGPTNGRLAFRYFVESGGPAGDHSDFIGIDAVSVGGGSALLSEDFEAGIPSDWAVFGNEHSGDESVWIAYEEGTLGHVARSRYSFNIPSGQVAEDYLATPLVNIGPGGAVLSFLAADQFDDDYGSEYEVLVSTTSQTDPAAYTTVAFYTEDDFETASDGGSVHTVDLSEYAGQSIHVAFLHRGNNGDTFYLDDVEITSGGGEAALVATPSALAFGEVIIGVAETETVTVSNTGTAPATLTEVTASNAAYTTDFAGPAELAPGQSLPIEVTFAPTAEGAANATLTLAASSDDLTVALSGSGLRPPQAELSAEALALEVVAEQTATAALTLSNAAATGAADLTYQISLVPTRLGARTAPHAAEAIAPEAPRQGALARSADEAVVAMGTALGTGLPTVSYAQRGDIDCQEEPGIIIQDDGTLDNGYTASGAAFDFVTLVDRFTPEGYPATFTGTCVAFIALSGAPTTLDFELVVHDDDGPGGGPGTLLGSVAATATDIPVLASLPPYPIVWQRVDLTEMDLFIEDGSVYIGVRYAPSDSDIDVFLGSDESPGRPVGLAGGYRGTQAGDGPVAWGKLEDSFPNYRALFVRPVAAPALALLAVSPREGTIVPGASENLTITLDAEGVEPGEYTFDVMIATNDPANPSLTVPVAVTVTGGIATEEGALPTEFALSQNYPNPFAGHTTIEYALPEATSVKLSVFDAVGRLVATLVDGEREAGFHAVEWPANGLASGVYFYRIEAGSYRSTQKMVLVQ